jgi:hypothetical protein
VRHENREVKRLRLNGRVLAPPTEAHVLGECTLDTKATGQELMADPSWAALGLVNPTSVLSLPVKDVC